MKKIAIGFKHNPMTGSGTRELVIVGDADRRHLDRILDGVPASFVHAVAAFVSPFLEGKRPEADGKYLCDRMADGVMAVWWKEVEVLE